MRRIASFYATIAGLLLAQAPAALAHHVNEGELPRNFTEGLLSGLAHPVIGPDHLVFMIALGLVAYLVKRSVLLPLLFVAGTLAGCFLHLYEVDIPMVEPLIASSVLMFGGLLALKAADGGSVLWLPAAVIAGVFHGYAYAESIIGSVNSAFSAYLIGFAAVQFIVAHSVARLASTVPLIRDHTAKIGVVLSVLGGYFLYGTL